MSIEHQLTMKAFKLNVAEYNKSNDLNDKIYFFK